MSRLVAKSINQVLLKEAIKYLKSQGDHESYIALRLHELLKYIRTIEQDIEADKSQHIAGKRPQARRIQFAQLATQLDSIAEELSVFLAPKIRYKKDREFPPTRPIGVHELRRSIANHFTETLSAEFMGSFGINPMEFNKNIVSLGPINTRNRAFAIEAVAEDVIVDLLHRSAAALREAEQELANNTPKGGPRGSKIRDVLLMNIVAIWHEIDGRGGKVSYSRGSTKFFNFCVQVCKAVGAGNLCTETHLRDAVKNYNEKISTKNLEPN